MNTANILLAMTSLLVVVAFALSFGKFTKSSNSTEALKERLALENELAMLQAEREALSAPAPYLPPANYPAPMMPSAGVSIPQPTQEVSDETAEEIKRLKEQLAESEETTAKVERKNEVLEKETSVIFKRETREQQRAARAENRIRIALLMGKVASVNTEYGFITFQSENGMSFQPGQKLGIRRGSGILGRVEVSSAQGSEYSANIKPNAYAGSGLPPVAVGDELIKLPDDYLSPPETGE